MRFICAGVSESSSDLRRRERSVVGGGLRAPKDGGATTFGDGRSCSGAYSTVESASESRLPYDVELGRPLASDGPASASWSTGDWGALPPPAPLPPPPRRRAIVLGSPPPRSFDRFLLLALRLARRMYSASSAPPPKNFDDPDGDLASARSTVAGGPWRCLSDRLACAEPEGPLRPTEEAAVCGEGPP
jgi:hypothetical protein